MKTGTVKMAVRSFYFVLKENNMIAKYIKTASMSAQNKTLAGIIYLLPDALLRVVCLIPLLMLWRTLFGSGVDTGMQLSQMLSYTYISALLSELLVITSPLTNWFYDGALISVFQRPMSIYGHVAAQTLGAAVPSLLVFSVPMALLSPIFGISIIPDSFWFFPSLLLCISLGFAIEFLFACLFIRMVNATWLAYTLRKALLTIFSGTVIPFAVMPWGIGSVLACLPFGSLAGAPLALYTGLAAPGQTIVLQVIWNIILWPTAVLAFRKSQERMVSHGG